MTGPVALAGTTSLSSGAGIGDITFTSTVNGARNLTVFAGAGDTLFGANVGGTTPLLSLTATASEIRIQGSQVRASGGTLTFNSPVVIEQDTTFEDTGTTGITFEDTISCDPAFAHDLILDASTAGAITAEGTIDVASLDSTSFRLSTFNGLITTTGNISIESIDESISFADMTSSGAIFVIAGTDIGSTGAHTIQTMGGGNITLVTDNLFPTAPSVGLGRFDIPNLTITSAGEVQLYTGFFDSSSFPATINGTPYVPGDGVNEEFEVYYPAVGGTPFTVFYKTEGGPPPPPPPPSPFAGGSTEERNQGRFKYFAVMSEAFSRMGPYSFGSVAYFDFYSPMRTLDAYYQVKPFMVGVPQRPYRYSFRGR